MCYTRSAVRVVPLEIAEGVKPGVCPSVLASLADLDRIVVQHQTGEVALQGPQLSSTSSKESTSERNTEREKPIGTHVFSESTA